MTASRKPAQWLLAAVLVIELVAFLPALAQQGVIRAPAAKFSDGTGQVYPWHIFWRDEVAAGRAPFWNPYVFAGTPAAAEPQIQTFYPANALWLVIPPQLASKLTLLLHVMLGSALMYGLVRQLGASPIGGAVSALAFGLHGQIAVYCFAGWTQMIAPMAWAPGVLWALARACDPARPLLRGAAITGVLIGVQILSGHPEWARYTLMSAALFVAFSRSGTLMRRAGAFAVALAIGVLVAGPQLFPTLEAARLSSRGSQAMEQGPNLHGAGLPPLTLPTMIVPRLFGPWDLDVSTDGVLHKAGHGKITFGESLVYVGLLPLGLAVFAAVRRVPGAAPWAVISIAGVLFALNDVTHLQCALDRVVRFDAVFRSPGRFVFMANLGLAVLAGLGVSRLASTGVLSPRLLRAGLAACAVGAIAAGSLYALRGPIAEAALARVTISDAMMARVSIAARNPRELAEWAVAGTAGQLGAAAALGAASILAMWWFARAPGTARALGLLTVIALDLGFTARPFLTSVVDVDVLYARDLARLAPIAAAPGARFIAAPEALQAGPNIAIMARARGLLGYDTFVLPEFERLQRAAAAGDAALAVMGVTHKLDAAGRVTPVVGARGRAWFAARAHSVDTADAAGMAIATAHDVVILDGALPPADAAVAAMDVFDARDPVIEVGVDLPNRFEARIDVPASGWLVVTDVFYPGWEARVNGTEVDVRRAFGAIRAVPVPAGASTVEMRFAPPRVYWGAAACAVGLLLAALLVATGRRGLNT